VAAGESKYNPFSVGFNLKAFNEMLLPYRPAIGVTSQSVAVEQIVEPAEESTALNQYEPAPITKARPNKPAQKSMF